MRVLMLGGTEFTGPAAVRRLHALGHEVTVFHRGLHEADLPAAVRHIHGTMVDPPQDLRRLRPDVIVHLLCMTGSDAAAFLDLFAGSAARVVVVSSGDVYRAYGRLSRLEPGDPDPVPLTEDAPLRESRFPYRGKSLPGIDTDRYDKMLVEEVIRNGPLAATILRYPAVYGPNDPYHRMRQWITPILSGAPEIRLAPDMAQWCWTHGYAADVAEAVVLAATSERAAGRTYNVGERETPTSAERIAEWGRVAGWTGRVIECSGVPPEQRLPMDFRHHLVYDTTRIREELGYCENVPRDEGIARTIEWERRMERTTVRR
jgi:nucleoside-diphosphate-sugar epimerase